MGGHLNLKKNGFSLVEMLIALAVSAIIIGAAFGSYTIISRNFEFQKDMKSPSSTAKFTRLILKAWERGKWGEVGFWMHLKKT